MASYSVTFTYICYAYRWRLLRETTAGTNIYGSWKLIPSYLAEYQSVGVSGVKSTVPDNFVVDVMFLC
jgi:hypothetical protein